MKLTLKELRMRVQDETDAYLLLEELRWHGTPVCPHCGNEKAYFLNPKGGSRGTGPKRHDGERTKSVRRVWKCAACRKQFSVLTGTIFHGTKVALADWLTVMVLMSSAKNGISAREVERLIGVTPETAWHMLHRLREAMRREPLVGMLTGMVMVDETLVGGKAKNRHVGVREADRREFNSRSDNPGTWRNRNRDGKTIVLSLVSKETGEVRSRVIPDVTGATLRKAIAEQVDMATTTLVSDEWVGYRQVGPETAEHVTVNHRNDEYVRYEPTRVISTNQAEGFFSQLKRSLDGTHHHVSSEHLHRYLAEFDFRYSTRKLSDPVRLQQMVDRAAGRRLSYKPLTER